MSMSEEDCIDKLLFVQWLETEAPTELCQWSKKLIELGVSWNSFRELKSEEIVNDFVNSGIPLLKSRQIVNLATRKVIRNDIPLAIFWDLENVQIPTNQTGREAVKQIKSLVHPYGTLVKFRAYASIGLDLVLEEKRSDLHLSAVELVDCPHAGKKEVVDKTIIVDVMQFAYENADGATICIITNDDGYAYLVSVIQKNPQWHTIVISNHTPGLMLKENCEILLRWNSRSNLKCDENETHSNDAKMLQEVFSSLLKTSKDKYVRKSALGQALKENFPSRFHERDTLKTFLSQKISSGLLTEKGQGAFKVVKLNVQINDDDILVVGPRAAIEPTTSKIAAISVEQSDSYSNSEIDGRSLSSSYCAENISSYRNDNNDIDGNDTIKHTKASNNAAKVIEADESNDGKTTISMAEKTRKSSVKDIIIPPGMTSSRDILEKAVTTLPIESFVYGGEYVAKSDLCAALNYTFPSIFHDKISTKEFLSRTIHEGLLIEQSFGQTKSVKLAFDSERVTTKPLTTGQTTDLTSTQATKPPFETKYVPANVAQRSLSSKIT